MVELLRFKTLNIGGDVAKDEVVVACSEASIPTRPLANQRTALLDDYARSNEFDAIGVSGNALGGYGIVGCLDCDPGFNRRKFL